MLPESHGRRGSRNLPKVYTHHRKGDRGIAMKYGSAVRKCRHSLSGVCLVLAAIWTVVLARRLPSIGMNDYVVLVKYPTISLSLSSKQGACVADDGTRGL